MKPAGLFFFFFVFSKQQTNKAQGIGLTGQPFALGAVL